MSAFKAITWTRDRVKELRLAYERAESGFKDTFEVEITGQGKHTFDRGYARHLLAYLDEQFAGNPDQPRQPYNEGKEGE